METAIKLFLNKHLKSIESTKYKKIRLFQYCFIVYIKPNRLTKLTLKKHTKTHP